MEAVAWRWRYKGTNWVYGNDRPAWADVDDCDEVIQALAVIPTEGLGSSSPKSEDTHRVAETAVVARIEAALDKAQDIGTDRVLFGRPGPGLLLDDVRSLISAARRGAGQ